MLTFQRRSPAVKDPLRLASFMASHARQAGPRWVDFQICPHCVATGRPFMLERLNECGPMISRSDGVSFHLVMGDRPIVYPAERATGKSEMVSAGFWYVHEANGGSTETVVVIVRRPPGNGGSLLRHFEKVADKLFEKLRKLSRLSCLYEFDGRQLHQVVY